MSHLRDPFIDALQEPKLLQILKANPDIAPHFADADFATTIEKLHWASRELPNDPTHMDWTAMGQKTAHEAYADVRLMQAIMTLYGKPPKPGEPRRNESVQAAHLKEVDELDDAEDAKAKGNDYVKKADHAMALAHYQRAITILRMKEPLQATALVSVLSNASLCLLKLQWPDRAKTSATQALRTLQKVGDTKFDQSKLYYRRALACEQMEDFANAEDDMKRAQKEAERAGLQPAEQQRLRNEVVRVQRLHKQSIEKQMKADQSKYYWDPYVQTDPVARYEEANKWSRGPVEARFDPDGRTHMEGRVKGEGYVAPDAPETSQT